MSQEGDVLKVLGSIVSVDAASWDRCAGTENPFLSHAFLSALEESGSATQKNGWMPQHLALFDGAGVMIGAVPLYLKSHSYGEYVFDHSWAHAYEQAGGNYYPKLQACVPFTPVPGPRLLVAPDAPAHTKDILAQGMVELARQAGVSSLHVTFPDKDDSQFLGESEFLKRVGVQFHWENQGYSSFEDFLGSLASRKRKQIRKERRDALEDGITIRMLRGSDIRTTDWDAFFRFYRATVDRKWGEAYLKRRFFDLLSERIGDRTLLVMADRHGAPIAGALNLIGKDTLYGRNWGAAGEFRFLHFEVCYYRAIEFAIENGLKRVEAGAQGTHKIQRGYLPALTYSAHWFKDLRLKQAIANFLDRETAAVLQQVEELSTLSPMKRCGDGSDE